MYLNSYLNEELLNGSNLINCRLKTWKLHTIYSNKRWSKLSIIFVSFTSLNDSLCYIKHLTSNSDNHEKNNHNLI